MTVIVDYEAGNLRSVQRACAEVGLSARITNDPAAIARAERIIFPGVGAAGSAMRSLRAARLDTALIDAFHGGVPILGICLGLQIALAHSEENDTRTLGLVDGDVVRFRLDDPALKIPHMGWNEVRVVQRHPVLASVQPGDEFYFVHAYYPRPANSADVFAEASYERVFCCALGRGNFFGTQFHPEKSGRVGLELLSCFARWDGSVEPQRGKTDVE
jgi:imidazole glycerol-phosphate synthase subunit HisH